MNVPARRIASRIIALVLVALGCGGDDGGSRFDLGKVATLELFAGTVGVAPGETITVTSGSLLPGEEDALATLRFINTGQADLFISELVLSSEPPGVYRLAASDSSREPLRPGPYTIVPQAASTGLSSLVAYLFVKRPERGLVPNATLTIRSNTVSGDRSMPEIVYPIKLEILPPRLFAVPDSVDFGIVPVGETDQASLVLDNRGGDTLSIHRVEFTGDIGFGMSLGSHTYYSGPSRDGILLNPPFEIRPGNQATVGLQYAAVSSANAEAELLFFSNDPTTATQGVRVSVVANAGNPSAPVVALEAPAGADGQIDCRLIAESEDTEPLIYTWYWRLGDGAPFTTFGPILGAESVKNCDSVACWTEVSDGHVSISSNVDSQVLPFGPDCDDHNSCTDDACNPEGGCLSVSNRAPCPDGDLCNGEEICLDGTCTAGAPVSCSRVSSPCIEDECNPDTGRCDLPKRDGTPCPDEDLCDGSEVCASGDCVAASPVDCSAVSSPCLQRTCNPATGVCDLASPDNAPCPDDDLCNGDEVCISGVCTAGTPTVCSDVVPCHAQACNPSTGQCDIRMPDGTPCPDLDPCNGEEMCADGQCVSGTPVACGDACGVFGISCPTGFARSIANTCENSLTGEVWVPAGTFWMGCNSALDTNCLPNEFEQHRVNLSSYAIDAQHVTASKYHACVDAGVCTAPADGEAIYKTYETPTKGDHPINYVTWVQAKSYCEWAGKSAGAQRLCTEAEWERAARGGCDTIIGDCRTNMRTFPWGEDPPDCSYANIYYMGAYCQPQTFTAAVGSTPSGNSCYGLQDAAGNVMQWVSDWYAPTYSSLEVTDPEGPSGPDDVVGHARVFRGGSFYTTASVRASVRSYGDPNGGVGYFVGIRCCRDVP